MLKKFNENWGSLEKRDDEKERWKRYWDKMSRDVNFEMDTIAEYAMKNSISYEEAEKIFKSTFNVGDRVINRYTGEKSTIISKKTREGEVLYELRDIDDNYLGWSIGSVLLLDNSEIKFKKGFECIGLPSGQILYLNLQQLNYFKARDVIKWTNIWKKPVRGGFYPIELKSYTFEDKHYKNIIDMIDTITWK